ncbi:MAG: BsuBI/PstI family type II restriction endonuclease, partial [Vicinamibacterales bacterium]
MTSLLPVIGVALAQERLARIFPRTAFDTVMSNPLSAAAVSAMIYLGTVENTDDDEAEPRWARPSMITWLNDDALAHTSDEDRNAWYAAAIRSRAAVHELEEVWGFGHVDRYRDNSRETLRDETFQKWRDQGAVISRAGVPTASSRPRWMLGADFAALFDPGLDGEELTAAIDAWVETNTTGAGRLRLLGQRQLALSEHAVEVNLPGMGTRHLEPGVASAILKGVVEQWAPQKLVDPLVLSISEPGDQVHLADARLLARAGIEIDRANVLPDALILDAGADPIQFWIVEATGGSSGASAWTTTRAIRPGRPRCRLRRSLRSRSRARPTPSSS